MHEHPPIGSEHEASKEAEAYDRWFRAKVAAALADPRPPIRHEEVMARCRSIIADAKERSRARSC